MNYMLILATLVVLCETVSVQNVVGERTDNETALQGTPDAKIKVTIVHAPPGIKGSPSNWTYESVFRLLMLINASEDAAPVRRLLGITLQSINFDEETNLTTESFTNETAPYNASNVQRKALRISDKDYLLITNHIAAQLPDSLITVGDLKSIMERQARENRQMGGIAARPTTIIWETVGNSGKEKIAKLSLLCNRYWCVYKWLDDIFGYYSGSSSSGGGGGGGGGEGGGGGGSGEGGGGGGGGGGNGGGSSGGSGGGSGGGGGGGGGGGDGASTDGAGVGGSGGGNGGGDDSGGVPDSVNDSGKGGDSPSATTVLPTASVADAQ